MKKILLYLPDDLHDAMKQEADKQGDSLAAYIRAPHYAKLRRIGYSLVKPPKHGGKRPGAGMKPAKPVSEN